MSVINKMLQDLDARQTEARQATHLYTKPAASNERRLSPRLLAGGAGAAALLVLGVLLGWRYWHVGRQPVTATAAPVKVVMAAAPPMTAPLPGPLPSAAGTVSAPSAAQQPAEPVPAPTPVVEAKPRKHNEAPDAAPRAPTMKPDERARRAASAQQQAAPAAATPAEKTAVQDTQVSPAQKAESAYRRGVASIQEGYLSDGIEALEQALRASPSHEAARQTLVRVLVDNKQFDEAMRQLQVGLSLDPRQPSMAMLLARLQIEHGGTGIDALMRTLPYAEGNAEYHAFLAGALQRQQRHREAVEQYQLALRNGPQSGVWLTGLGISLQAGKRNAEALDAFQKAKNSAALSAELLSFVDLKIRQLSR